jgi:hypothetical protein
MAMSERQLIRLYNKFNLLYFNNGLPPVRIFYSPVDGGYADCCQLEDGVMQVRINPSVGGWVDFLKLTLLHEMVHVKLWPYRKHGVRFDREVQRLMGFKEIRALV